MKKRKKHTKPNKHRKKGNAVVARPEQALAREAAAVESSKKQSRNLSPDEKSPAGLASASEKTKPAKLSKPRVPFYAKEDVVILAVLSLPLVGVIAVMMTVLMIRNGGMLPRIDRFPLIALTPHAQPDEFVSLQSKPKELSVMRNNEVAPNPKPRPITLAKTEDVAIPLPNSGKPLEVESSHQSGEALENVLGRPSVDVSEAGAASSPNVKAVTELDFANPSGPAEQLAITQTPWPEAVGRLSAGQLAAVRAPKIALLKEGGPFESAKLGDYLPLLLRAWEWDETAKNVCYFGGAGPTLLEAEPAVNIQGLSDRAFGQHLAAAAEGQLKQFVIYNEVYVSISYPLGDVPQLFGVCTDVVIRAYRALGIDLQELVYRARVGSGDRSIDHRRTQTLRRFFARKAQSLPVTDFSEDYLPGDIVTYYRPQNRGSKYHIAIVSNQIAPSGRPMIIHNRGWGPQIEDALFVDEITGHYRFRADPNINRPDESKKPIADSDQNKPGPNMALN